MEVSGQFSHAKLTLKMTTLNQLALNRYLGQKSSFDLKWCRQKPTRVLLERGGIPFLFYLLNDTLHEKPRWKWILILLCTRKKQILKLFELNKFASQLWLIQTNLGRFIIVKKTHRKIFVIREIIGSGKIDSLTWIESILWSISIFNYQKIFGCRLNFIF